MHDIVVIFFDKTISCVFLFFQDRPDYITREIAVLCNLVIFT